MSKHLVPIEQKLMNADWVKKQNEVWDDFVRGEQNPTTLAKRHNITRAEAIQMIDHVNQYMRQSGVFKEMAKERLGQMDHHFNMLIKEGWQAVEDMKDAGDKPDKIATTLKVIADIESKRQESLQKAGAYEDYEVGDMLAESEAKIDAIKELLKQVIKEFPEAKTMILNGLRDIQDPNRLPEPEVIDGETV